MMKLFWMESLILLFVLKWVGGVILCNETNSSVFEDDELVGATPTHDAFVPLTLINGGAAKGAVCLDGTVPGYHLDRGYGAGKDSWLIQLEGGAWCNSVRNCIYRKKLSLGSSAFMGKGIFFRGILSNNPRENPDFHNWNRIKLRYCDGASFLGDGRIKEARLNFGGQGIWFAAMEELMSRGMKFAKQALLSGCSAGGLSSIMHCDQFRGLFPASTTVKCLSDGGLFLDVADIAGIRNIRNFYDGVVNLQGVKKNLPMACTNRLDPTSCFFPQNVIDGVKTPLFLLNSAYDSWQIQSSLTPHSADPKGYWKSCRLNMAACSSSQLQFLQNFRLEMLKAVDTFSRSTKNGLFINSCFAHCQTENDGWSLAGSPTIGKTSIAAAVGNWYFNRGPVKTVDCPYPCGKTGHSLSRSRN